MKILVIYVENEPILVEIIADFHFLLSIDEAVGKFVLYALCLAEIDALKRLQNLVLSFDI